MSPPQTAVTALGAGLLVAILTTPVGVSGAVFLLPIQLDVLGIPRPAVTPTNLLFNVIATDRYDRPTHSAEHRGAAALGTPVCCCRVPGPFGVGSASSAQGRAAEKTDRRPPGGAVCPGEPGGTATRRGAHRPPSWTYLATIDELGQALTLIRTAELRGRGAKAKASPLALCGCRRKLRVSKSMLAAGLIVCGVWGGPFDFGAHAGNSAVEVVG